MLSELLIKKLIFLVQWPITTYEERAWNFDFLRNQGYIVEVLDLSPLLNSELHQTQVIPNRSIGEYIFKIYNYFELDNFLAKNSNDSIFVDYLVNHSSVTLNVEKVYRLMSKYQSRFIVISSGALPGVTFESSVKGQLKKLTSKVKKALNIKCLIGYLGSKTIMFLTRHKILYPIPFKIFGGSSSEAMKLFISNRGIDRENVVQINSFDYDTYLTAQKQPLELDSPEEKICVFLDEAITDHPDFGFLNIDYISPDEYFDSMNKLFDFIEDQIGLKVVVAAHPRSTYETNPGVFKNRKIIKGKTAALAIKSELLIMHMSTSVSFGVIGFKPIVIIKTNGIQNNTYLNKLVDNIAATLGTQLINIDQDKLTTNLFKQTINQEKYNTYLYKYIKSPNAQDLSVWEIVLLEIKKLRKEK